MDYVVSTVSCGSCRKSSRRQKVLSCLHTVCIACLEQYIHDDGSVSCPTCKRSTLPPGRGKPTVDSLQDSCQETPSADGGKSAADGNLIPTPLCDLCAEDRPAETRCLNCPANLCDVHDKAHALSRVSCHHRTIQVNEEHKETTAGTLSSAPASSSAAATGGPPSKKCLLHPSEDLDRYCVTCKELLCNACISLTASTHSHNVLTLEVAAKNRRHSLQQIVTDSLSETEGKLTQSLRKVQDSISHLNDSTKDVSEEVEKYFSALIDAVRKRKETLLLQLEDTKSKKSVPLEKQECRLQRCIEAGKHVVELMKSCSDPGDFMRMSDWLQDALTQEMETAQSDSEPCEVFQMTFNSQQRSSSIFDAIGSIGAIADKSIDQSKSTLRCPHQASVNSPVVLVIEAEDCAGNIVTWNQPAAQRLKFTAHAPDGTTIRCQIVTGHSPTTIQATISPPIPGQFTISAKVASQHLINSPHTLSVVQPTFDATRCHKGILLSQNGRTALYNNRQGGWSGVCGANVTALTPIQIRIRLDRLPSSGIYVGFSNAPTPLLDGVKPDQAMYGWNGRLTDLQSYCHGGKLGQPWQEGDIIELTLDCSKHTLTGVHERQGTATASERLMQVEGRLYLLVKMICEGQQVTIL